MSSAAGLPGLSAAVAAGRTRRRAVELIEARRQAGGRCRSYFDPALEQVIDNGNHLVLSGNHARAGLSAHASAREDALAGPDRAEFAFADVASGARWTIRPNDGPLALVDFRRRRAACRAPGRRTISRCCACCCAPDRQERIGDVIALRRPAVGPACCSPSCWPRSTPSRRRGSAALAGAVMRETLAKGGRAYRPRIAHPTLAAAFVDPALAFLQAQGRECSLRPAAARARLRTTPTSMALELPDATRSVEPDDTVILAVPPWVATELVPGLTAPDEFRAIVNAHFQIAPPAGAPLMLGVIGGTAEWIFAFAGPHLGHRQRRRRLVDKDREELARLFWRDVSKVARPAGGAAALADRQGKARHLRRHARNRTLKRPKTRDALAQPVPRRRLDRYRPARPPSRARCARAESGAIGLPATWLYSRA